MDIYTPLGWYTRMIIISLEALRDKASGNAYLFDIDFQEEVIWNDENRGQSVSSNTDQVTAQDSPQEGNVPSEEVQARETEPLDTRGSIAAMVRGTETVTLIIPKETP